MASLVDGVSIISAKVKKLVENEVYLTVTDMVGSWTICKSFGEFLKLDESLHLLFDLGKTKSIIRRCPIEKKTLLKIRFFSFRSCRSNLIKQIDDYLIQILTLPPFVSKCRVVVEFLVPNSNYKDDHASCREVPEICTADYNSTYQTSIDEDMIGESNSFVSIDVITRDGDIITFDLIKECNYSYFSKCVLEKLLIVEYIPNQDSLSSDQINLIKGPLEFIYYVDSEPILLSDLEDLNCALAFFGNNLMLKLV